MTTLFIFFYVVCITSWECYQFPQNAREETIFIEKEASIEKGHINQPNLETYRSLHICFLERLASCYADQQSSSF